MRASFVLLGSSVAMLVLLASPASADPAAPTNYSSTVRAIEPAVQGVRVRVVGGDAFLEVRVAAGHEVVVYGYEGEAYLRIGADGTVDENVRSPAVVLNQARYGKIEPGSDADAKAEPVWKRVGSNGTYVWHDHRIHWMSSAVPPPQLAGASSGSVFEWTVPIRVDGAEASVKGDLVLREAPSATPYVVLGAALFLAFAALMYWRRAATALVLAGCPLFAFVVSLLDQLSLPAAAGRQASLYTTPAIAFACAAGALVAPRGKYAPILKLAAVLVLPLWIFRYTAVLTNAVLPGDLSPVWLRCALVSAIAGALAYLVAEAPRELRSTTAAPPPGEERSVSATDGGGTTASEIGEALR